MIYVTVLTHNRVDHLRLLLESPYFEPDVTRMDACVLVLNQGSTDGTTDFLQRWEYKSNGHNRESIVTALNAPQNAGIICGHQRQMEWLLKHGLKREDTVVFLDDDCYPTARGWLGRLARPLVVESQIAITGCYGARITADWQLEQAMEPGVVDIVSMSHTAVSARLFLEGFEFPADFGDVWHEDAFLCLWAKEHGYLTYYVGAPESIGLHHEPHHKVTDDLYWANWERIKARFGALHG